MVSSRPLSIFILILLDTYMANAGCIPSTPQVIGDGPDEIEPPPIPRSVVEEKKEQIPSAEATPKPSNGLAIVQGSNYGEGPNRNPEDAPVPSVDAKLKRLTLSPARSPPANDLSASTSELCTTTVPSPFKPSREAPRLPLGGNLLNRSKTLPRRSPSQEPPSDDELEEEQATRPSQLHRSNSDFASSSKNSELIVDKPEKEPVPRSPPRKSLSDDESTNDKQIELTRKPLSADEPATRPSRPSPRRNASHDSTNNEYIETHQILPPNGNDLLEGVTRNTYNSVFTIDSTLVNLKEYEAKQKRQQNRVADSERD